jgi:hypothetical protein
MSNQEESNPMNVQIESIIKRYQQQVSELTLQSYIKDEQIENLQAKIKELQDSKSAKEAKK